ncbi:MAG: PPK2 family polyphosphate:nucleotide phosphotransferase [Kangiellaceae bacterium]|jgi:PPK2 family polyphosphate:nucleotide phosphotransferase
MAKYEDFPMEIKVSIKTNDFKVTAGLKYILDECPTSIEPLYDSKKNYQKRLKKHVRKLSKQQQLLYGSNKYSLLVIFQAMDAAGKDGVIRHVMSGINPQGCQVTSFKHPSAIELEHDFLWRSNQALPERGRIGVFNRSYYEEVLIVRVHPEILDAQKIPGENLNKGKLWEERFDSINNLEKHIHNGGTRIIKIFLHLSPEEQRVRFIDRIDDPDKNWKFTDADIHERQFWPQYQQAYQECLHATSTNDNPWYIVPADDKKNARLIVAKIMHKTLKALNMNYPISDEQRKLELQLFKQKLLK